MDPTNAGVHLSLSRLHGLGEWQWERSRNGLQHALELGGTDQIRSLARAWQGFHMVERGEFDNGLQLLQTANAAYPTSTFIVRFLADAHFLARDFSGSEAVCRKALQLHVNCWLLHRAMGRAFTALGEYGEARRCYRRAILLHNAPQAGLLAEFAYLDAVKGNADSAARRVAGLQQRQYRPVVSIAQVHTALGNHDRALDCLEQACTNRDWSLAALKQDIRFDPLRTSARFRRILAQVGI